MRKTMMFAAGGLVVTLGLGGCSTGTPATTGPTVQADKPAQSAADRQVLNTQIDQDLSRLNELQVIHSGQLLVDLPSEATACYGVPCPGSSWVQPYWDERAHQAARLHTLANLATTTMPTVSIGDHVKSEADAALSALSALSLIEGASLIEAQPASNVNCYSLACPSDIAAADQATALNVAKVFALVDAAKHNGL